MIHKKDNTTTLNIPFIVLNISTNSMHLEKVKNTQWYLMWISIKLLLKQYIKLFYKGLFRTQSYIVYHSVSDIDSNIQENKIKTSSAEIDVHDKVKLQDANTDEESRQQFDKLCKEY